MNVPAETEGAVLRNVRLQADAVRVGRGNRAARPAPRVAAAAPAPQAPPPPDRDALLAEALQQAREEGLRLGRQEGLEAGREEGREEGRRKGEAEARADAKAALEQAIAAATEPLRERERALGALLASLPEQQSAWRAQAEDEAVALAYEVVCRVVGETLLTPEGVQAQARRWMDKGGAQEAPVHVHPEDAQRLLAMGEIGGAVRWVADPEVKLGGCIVRRAEGTLDARLETILEQCREALLETRARRAQSAGDGEA